MKNTIKENRDFVYAYRRGKKFVSPYFVVYLTKNNAKLNKLGITVSKSIGKAHSRNRAKRLIRHAYKLCNFSSMIGYNVVVVARESILEAPFEKICMQMFNILKNIIETTDTGDGNV